ncbi:hypothetical protein [Candidatus Kinetoplastidibacterium stringomonadis]|uniref:hypothetical protein n=1 Tax=Candidatus Kinetoplastidibacterium stringomonadis TaxID=994696 RepID=UPI0005A4AE91|nr:hypothetical protein [Candidatus Kinetoplastibacterium oncopeltii]
MINFQKSDWTNITNLGKDNFLQVRKMFLKNCQCINDHKLTNSNNNYSESIERKKVCSIANLYDREISTKSKETNNFLKSYLQPWIFLDSANNLTTRLLTSRYEPLL